VYYAASCLKSNRFFLLKGEFAMSKEKKAGFYWHMNPRALMEQCYDYTKRRAEMLSSRSLDENTREHLRLFKRVKSELPETVMRAQQVIDAAQQASREACQAYDEMRRIRDEDRSRTYQTDLDQACDKAFHTLQEARLVYERARQTYINTLLTNKTAIEELHQQECPNCPWDGETIFPNSDD